MVQTVVLYSERRHPSVVVSYQENGRSKILDFIICFGMAPDSLEGVVCFVEEQIIKYREPGKPLSDSLLL